MPLIHLVNIVLNKNQLHWMLRRPEECSPRVMLVTWADDTSNIQERKAAGSLAGDCMRFKKADNLFAVRLFTTLSAKDPSFEELNISF